MFGGFKIKIYSKRLIYDFTINRKITKIVGYSATGKSTLYKLLSMYTKNKNTDIQVNCKYPCKVFPGDIFELVRRTYYRLSKSYSNHKSVEYYNACREFFSEWDNTLYFLDEDNLNWLNSIYFAAFCKYTDAFFVITARIPLEKIPYSYKDIYIMKESGKYHWLEQKIGDRFNPVKHVSYLVEDSNSGYEALNRCLPNVISAHGNSNIAKLMSSDMLVIADGAAIGPFIEKILKQSAIISHVDMYLPESFEYLVLKAFFSNTELHDRIISPEKYCNGLYFSWERYFTELLEESTKNLTNSYLKSSLNSCYIEDCCSIRTPSLRKNCNMLKVKNKFSMLFPELCGDTESNYKQKALAILQERGKSESDADEIYELAKMSNNIQVKDKWEAVLKFKDYL